MNFFFVRYAVSFFASVPLLVENIEAAANIFHPWEMAAIVTITFIELYACVRNVWMKRRGKDSHAGLLPCLCVTGLGGTLWVIGALISLSVIHQLGYLMLASGHIFKSFLGLRSRFFR